MTAAAPHSAPGGAVPPGNAAAAGRLDPGALHERATRYRVRLEARLPHQICPPDRPPPSLLARVLGLVVDEVAPASDGRLILHRAGLPPVLLDAATLRWRCAAGHAEGVGLAEAVAWLTDKPTLTAAALCSLACRTWGEAR
ncbi:hypothetical protein NON00_16435 [Roseomonas sp. GC11]|uniref:hypothetical protein n=1 Tax=Roseomonas sp. GC11 TaxID=2950546 RepID=UPI00210E654B|nr:hypothetical protein [Roseomonas sp. GC11]MCQ4161508.1 hypothetical protein [Roseomonas sp. GC11]